MIVRKKYINSIKQNGILIQTSLVDITQKKRIKIGHRTHRKYTQYIINCEGKNPITGEVMIFKSDEIEQNPSYTLENIKIIDVYVNNTNPKKYYVDVEELKKYLK